MPIDPPTEEKESSARSIASSAHSARSSGGCSAREAHLGSSAVQDAHANGTISVRPGGDATEISEEDEENEDEDEPALKYSKIGPAAAQIFAKDSASSLATSAKYIAIGTHSGHLFILDHRGEFVKRFKPHQASVQDIDIDEQSGFIATASVDGKCSVIELAIPEMAVYDMHRPMRAISMEPNFGKRNARQFVCGGMAGNLILHEKGWLGNKETILHSSEGPIWAVEWRGNFVAWANDEGVGIYDIAASKRVTFVRREANSPRADLFKCTLHWAFEDTLIVAWADTLKIVVVKERIDRSRGQLGLSGATQLIGEITANFQLDAMISSVAPYDKAAFLLLAYVAEDTYNKEATEDYAEQKRKDARRPELRIISAEGEEVSMDELALNGFARNHCSDYHLAPSRHDNSFVVLAPRDGLIARPCDAADHVTWLIDHQRYKKALAAIEKMDAAGKSGFDTLDIGKRYLEHLMHQGLYNQAAELCPKIFGQNVKAWEDWILVFVEKGQTTSVIPVLPTRNPQLGHDVYELVLAHLLRTDKEALLRTIRSWPKDVYDIAVVIDAIESVLDSSTTDIVLMDCLADLYLFDCQYSKALPYFLRLRRPGVFDLIRDHNLFTAIQDKALLLIDFDQQRQTHADGSRSGEDGAAPTVKHGPRGTSARRHSEAITLLVDNTQSIPIPRIVKQLASHRHYLYMYLDAVFDRDALLVADYSDLQVDLYAEFEPSRMMDFLRASNYFDLEKAYEICKRRDFVPEMVFLLGRMGNNKQALSLIIERLDDVQKAIDFAKEQNDGDLWEDLLKYSETRPRFIRGLLENVGPDVEPVNLIRRIRNGLEIPGLKQAIIKILQDYNLQVSLMEGCQSILFADCRALNLELHTGQASAFLGGPQVSCQRCGLPAFVPDEAARTPTEKAVSLVFLCRHVYHVGCAFPDLEDIPPRPHHPLMPTLLLNERGRNDDAARAIEGRIRFGATLRSRVDAKCPACSHSH